MLCGIEKQCKTELQKRNTMQDKDSRNKTQKTTENAGEKKKHFFILRKINPSKKADAPTAGEMKAQNVKDYVVERLAAEQTSEPAAEKSAEKKNGNKKKSSAAEIPTRRYSVSASEGLSAAQVEERKTSGLTNVTEQKYSKSYASIFISNICTFFNLLCLLATIALIYAGAEISQFFFVIVYLINLIFGIAVEIRSKRKIDKLSLLHASETRVVRGGTEECIPSSEIVLDDVLILRPGDQIPSDCILLDGNIEVNEALLTGESVPVKKNTGDPLYAGSFIAAGTCRAKAEKIGKNTYINTLSSKAKKYEKPKSELMRSIKLIISVIGILIIPIAIGMFFVNWNGYTDGLEGLTQVNYAIQHTVSIVIGMIPSGLMMLTSIALTLGIIRLMQRNTLVQDLYSLEMLARVNVLCLDKTGTITDGRMQVRDCILLNNPTEYSVNELVGNSLHALQDNNQTSQALYNHFGYSTTLTPTEVLPFSSSRKLSAVTFEETGTVITGAPEFVLRSVPAKLQKIITQYTSMGLRVLVVAVAAGRITGDAPPANPKPVAVITISDNIREDAAQTIRWFRENDVEVRIISGDNPQTVSEVAKRAGVENAEKYISLEGLSDSEVVSVANKYTVFGRVSPEQKALLVKSIKTEGNTVAMTGDGVNDILAMKQADCAISVASGCEAAKNVSHIVLMDNNFASMPSVVNEGRRVINNIQNSASLYLMKTLFVTVFALLSIILNTAYPFTTNNLMLIEFFVIGIPSFMLSLQPNKSRVQGKFLPNVLTRAIPCAIILILATESVNLIAMLYPLYFEGNTTELSICVLSFVGLVMLYRVCQPLNFYRLVLFLSTTCLCILSVLLLPDIFFGSSHPEPLLTFVQVLYLLVVILVAFPLSNALTTLAGMLQPSKRKAAKNSSVEEKKTDVL